MKKKAGVSVIVQCLGQKVSGGGSTVLEALEKMELRNVRGRTIMIVEREGSRKERVIMPQVVKRAFNTAGLTRSLSLKNIASLFE